MDFEVDELDGGVEELVFKVLRLFIFWWILKMVDFIVFFIWFLRI